MDIYTIVALSQFTQAVCTVLIATYVVKAVRYMRSK